MAVMLRIRGPSLTRSRVDGEGAVLGELEGPSLARRGGAADGPGRAVRRAGLGGGVRPVGWAIRSRSSSSPPVRRRWTCPTFAAPVRVLGSALWADENFALGGVNAGEADGSDGRPGLSRRARDGPHREIPARVPDRQTTGARPWPRRT